MLSNKLLIKIERKPEVLNRIGISRSNLFCKIQDGLWCPPISLGDRAVGFLQHETDTVLAAMCAGNSKSEIKELVSHLIEKRKNLQAAAHE
ncbi:MAG: AlpA family phage regulatory protein [Kangiellaceae bacterium]|nr:AlpA family phage regulatory protein [Kangiellaceae bacterium]